MDIEVKIVNEVRSLSELVLEFHISVVYFQTSVLLAEKLLLCWQKGYAFVLMDVRRSAGLCASNGRVRDVAGRLRSLDF